MNESERTAKMPAEVPFKVWQCILCGFIYEEAAGMPAEGIPPGTRWIDVPEDWICPECSVGKVDFEMIEI
jgi:rubredoxin